MSKKSTSRTGNDGDADYGSANGRSSSSEDSKCILLSNLSLKEEGATGPSGDYSSTHKILTPNLDESHRNHEIQTENDYMSNHSSHSSLDEDLYGTSDAFNKNLEFLKNKLGLFNFADTENSSHQRFDTTSRSDLDKHSNSKFKGRDGYLSTRETLINLSSPIENYKINEYSKSCSPKSKADLNVIKSGIATIYEPPEFYETDNTTSSDSFKIPAKKQCFRENTPRFSPNSSKITLNPSPKNLNLSLSLQKDSNGNFRNIYPSNLSSASLKSIPVSSPEHIQLHDADVRRPTSMSRSTDGSSPASSINYIVPLKRRCTREKTPKIIDSKISGSPPSFSSTDYAQPEGPNRLHIDINTISSKTETHLLRFTPPSEGEDSSAHTINTSWSASQRTKSESIGHSEILELGLNLPSSIIGDTTSSNKTTPLEPNIIIIDTSSGKLQKFKRRNKIAPISESSQSRPSSVMTIYSSRDQCRADENPNSDEMHRKYYEDTSEISSNVNSTPPCIVSTCASLTSSFPSAPSDKAISESNEQKFEAKSFNRSASSQTSNCNCSKPEVFNPLFSSSLDIPKRSIRTYIFPAFSRITSIPGSFILQNALGGTGDHGSNDELENKYRGECYKNKAECLLNSPTSSPVAKQKNNEQGDSTSVRKQSTETDSPMKRSFNNIANKRKAQSTDITFYSVPSHMSLDKEFSNKNFRADDSSSDTNTDIEENCANCCCFNIFFPRRRTRFFT